MLQTILKDVAAIGEQLVAEKPLVGMSVGVVNQKGQQVQTQIGKIDQYPEHKVEADTIYDLASLTKLYTAKAYVQLVLDQQFDLSRTLKSVLPTFNHPEITFQQVLTHSSGLPSSVRKTDHLDRKMLLEDLNNRPLLAEPGQEIHYSDVGYMLLGQALSEIMGMPLEQAMAQLVLTPLGLAHTGYRTAQMPNYQTLPTEAFAPTEYVPERGGLLQGTVDDYKAALLGGAAGHAGIFSPMADALRFVASWLQPEVVQLLQANRVDFRTLGWHYWRFGGEDHPSVEKDWLYQTGFTGTIMAINLKNQTGLVILTNRVYPNRQTYDWWRVDRYQLPQAFFARATR
ncbi:CubicO group peptidase (beta-lactamase class C family) [Weissella uvarum]|uniref:serine hydrolase domain-containing protein n=1 Tax=Weissella uvarum TaxID=1479233 RepID=UPI001960C45C|nr:serine hydrolase domain-containing protein [Weissella uvarum]MBM7617204.1 CubicO group peptidase (beta-lactamase class C family) [Weissella uvarum]MCM0595497.1 beta-lactamase family protein [Weissella uvarum]